MALLLRATIASCLMFTFACDRPAASEDVQPLDQSQASDSADKEPPKSKPTPAPKVAPVASLPQVDVKDLDADAKAMWLSLVNELLSPCGDPVSVARCVAENRKCSACVPAARYVSRLVNEGYQRDEIYELYRLRYDAQTKVQIKTDDRPSKGAAMAPVTIVEFSDFECPHCRLAAPELRRITKQFKGKVRVVFKHYPLPQHLNAMKAAIAAEAAGNQGKFWELHDLLFQNQRNLDPKSIEGYAKKIGLDLERFRADIQSDAVRGRVEADRAEGRKLQVDSTPYIFVQNRRYPFAADAMAEYVREELDQ